MYACLACALLEWNFRTQVRAQYFQKIQRPSAVHVVRQMTFPRTVFPYLAILYVHVCVCVVLRVTLRNTYERPDVVTRTVDDTQGAAVSSHEARSHAFRLSPCPAHTGAVTSGHRHVGSASLSTMRGACTPQIRASQSYPPSSAPPAWE